MLRMMIIFDEYRIAYYFNDEEQPEVPPCSIAADRAIFSLAAIHVHISHAMTRHYFPSRMIDEASHCRK